MKFKKLLFPFLVSVAFTSSIIENLEKRNETEKEIYIPHELRNMDFNNNNSQWSYERSKTSKNFVIFWEPGFGKNPSTASTYYKFDVDEVLNKAEEFYKYYIETLKFIDGKSQTEKYKMSIWVKYQTEWLATGAGYDNVVGALWVNPSTVQPVGSTIAHEVGHCFQYQVHCDGKYGFRDRDYVGSFWEICAQWMASRLYPYMIIDQDFSLFVNNCWDHPLHEVFRYQSVLMEEYWSEKHGIDIIGKVWNGAIQDDDPIDAYKRVTNIDQETFNNEMFECAQKNIYFDYKHLGPSFVNYREKYLIKVQPNNDGTYQILPKYCVQSYGFNPMEIEIPKNGRVDVSFTGITGIHAYNNGYDNVAGWRYGFVAVISNGKSYKYSEPYVGTTKTSNSTYTIPENTTKLWFVVMGAPTKHIRHHWIENNSSNEEQFPWRVYLSTKIVKKFTLINHDENLVRNPPETTTKTTENPKSNNGFNIIILNHYCILIYLISFLFMFLI